MSAVLKSTTKSNNNTFTGAELSSWSRQQKFAMLAGFAILAVVLVVCACSKQSQKHELATLSGSAPTAPPAPALTAQTQTPHTSANASPAPAKKAAKKRPVNVAYSDPNSGVSFVYPRKFPLTTGDKAQAQLADDAVPMNFTEAGGTTVATVALPKTLYPGTDFASAFFTVNVNRTLSEEQCSHFAFVDTSNGDGEPVDAEKVKVGSADMEMTSEFTGSATKQAEAQYYHTYENGACYEYVLGLGTAGYGVSDGVQPVSRDAVFARLEKILATVKIRPTEQDQAQAQAKKQDRAADADNAMGSAEAAK